MIVIRNYIFPKQ